MIDGHYHLVGVAGVGMSALAQALAAAGRRVTGSDRYRDQGDALPVIAALEQAGVAFFPQTGEAVGPQTRAVVLSTAIESDNPDVAAARRYGVPVRHRSELLAELTAGRQCIAVTGTSGKSTVTGMLGWILDVAGWAPNVVNGAPVRNWMQAGAIGNFRRGTSEWWVIEADESDRSLLRYTPEWGVITNASADHFSLAETRELLAAFAARARQGCVDAVRDPALLAEAQYGEEGEGVCVRWREWTWTAPVIGRHNAENAWLAAATALRVGVAPEVIGRALATFEGVARRLEIVGRARGVTVVDDYAHNPAKLRAAWDTLAARAPRVLGVWRPHGFGPLRQMMADLAATFGACCRPADRLYVMPVYDAGGTADRSVDAAALVALLQAQGTPAVGVADPQTLPAILADEARAGDIVAIMGARDPHLPDLARRTWRALG